LFGLGAHDRFDECGVVIPLRINRFVGEVAAAVTGRKELKAAGDIALNDADAFASTCGRNGGGGGGGSAPAPRLRAAVGAAGSLDAPPPITRTS